MFHRPGDSAIWAAGLILRRELADDERYLLLRSRTTGEWGFPKGHAEAGESLREAALRECAEECGIALVALEAPGFCISYPVRDQLKSVLYWPAWTCQSRLRLSDEHDAGGWYHAETVVERLPHDNLREIFTRHLDHRLELWP